MSDSESNDVEVVGPDRSDGDDSTASRSVEDHSVTRVETVVSWHHDDVAGFGVFDADWLSESALSAHAVWECNPELCVNELDVSRAVEAGGRRTAISVRNPNVLFRDGEQRGQVVVRVGGVLEVVLDGRPGVCRVDDGDSLTRSLGCGERREFVFVDDGCGICRLDCLALDRVVDVGGVDCERRQRERTHQRRPDGHDSYSAKSVASDSRDRLSTERADSARETADDTANPERGPATQCEEDVCQERGLLICGGPSAVKGVDELLLGYQIAVPEGKSACRAWRFFGVPVATAGSKMGV